MVGVAVAGQLLVLLFFNIPRIYAFSAALSLRIVRRLFRRKR